MACARVVSFWDNSRHLSSVDAAKKKTLKRYIIIVIHRLAAVFLFFVPRLTISTVITAVPHLVLFLCDPTFLGTFGNGVIARQYTNYLRRTTSFSILWVLPPCQTIFPTSRA
jgi:hypothetical protein